MFANNLDNLSGPMSLWGQWFYLALPPGAMSSHHMQGNYLMLPVVCTHGGHVSFITTAPAYEGQLDQLPLQF